NTNPDASDTITLAAGTTFTLTAVNNLANGSNGLPVIAANENLTLVGNGDIIERSTAAGTPAFRLFEVAPGAALTLVNLTLQGGLAFGGGANPQGGAVDNQGTLALTGVTVQNNTAQGAAGWDGAGGGVFSSGVLMVQGSTIQNNAAIGGPGIRL